MEYSSQSYFLYFALGIAVSGVYGTVFQTGRDDALEAKANATWLMRDADTLWSINNTEIAASVRSMLDGVPEVQKFTETTDSLGELSLLLSKRTGLKLEVTFQVAGYYPITLRNVQLDANLDMITTCMEPLLFISKRFTGLGTVTGTLFDLSKYNVVLNDVKLDFRSDMNSHTGTVVESVKTSADGTWNVTLPGGHYTVTALKSGYITVPFTVITVGRKSRHHSVTGLSPIIDDGGIRIVSLGGNQSRELYLPLHVRGPVEHRSERAYIYLFARVFWGSFVRYEVDSWNIQTVLIEKQLAGMYRISMSDWRLIRQLRNGTLWDAANSGASVQLYKGNKLWAQYFVPNRPGNAWSVVEINGSQLTTINDVTTVNSTLYVN